MSPLALPVRGPSDTTRWVLPVALPIAVVLAVHTLTGTEATGAVLRSVGVGAMWGGSLVAVKRRSTSVPAFRTASLASPRRRR